MPPSTLSQGRASRPPSRSPPTASEISDGEELEALPFTQDSLAPFERRRRLPHPCGLPTLALAALALACVAVLLFFAAHKRPALPPAPRPPAPPPPFRRFVTVNGSTFTDGCKAFIVVGVNIENLVEAAIPEVSEAARGGDPERPSGRALTAALLGAAGAAGVNVVRTWAHTTDPAHPLQRRAGEYDPAALDALDWTVAAAAAAGLRLQLSFVDTWRYHGGVQEFVDWSTTAAQRDPRWPPVVKQGNVVPGTDADAAERERYESRRRAAFFDDPGARALFKAHMSTILTRRNPYRGGLMYSHDSAIFSFNLINEPRCDAALVPGCPRLFQSWVEEMAAHFRVLDRNHLLTVGQEGFYGRGDPSEGVNPGAWGAATGQDFVANHRAAGISYAAIHAWPDNWASGVDGAEAFLQRWIETHAADAATRLGMPLVLEEVGRKVEPAPGTPEKLKELRDPVLRAVFAQVEAGLRESTLQEGETTGSMQGQGVEAGRAAGLVAPTRGGSVGLQGSMLWQLDLRLYDASPYSPYGIRVNDTAFELLRQHAWRVAAALSKRGSGGAACV